MRRSTAAPTPIGPTTYETVPSNALELALWLESDRMGFLLPALTQAKLDNQRDVVKNERRQRVDNVPYGQSQEKLLEALYPPDHPYHHSVIGSMADLSAASLDDVSAFFRTYYSPNNASLCIAGDFDPAETKRLVEKYFGPIPRGPEVPGMAPSVPVLAESKHITMTDRVSLPRVELVWPTVPRGDPDEPALDVLALVLGGLDKENRLFRALMYDRQLAAHVQAGHPASALAGDLRRHALLPGQASRSTSWSRSPTTRSSGSRTRGRPTPRSSRRRTPRRASSSWPPVGGQEGRLPQQLQRRVRRPAGLQGRDAPALRRHAGRRQAGRAAST